MNFPNRKSQSVKKNPKVVLKVFWRNVEKLKYTYILFGKLLLIADSIESIVLNKICAMNDLLNFCLKREMW